MTEREQLSHPRMLRALLTAVGEMRAAQRSYFRAPVGEKRQLLIESKRLEGRVDMLLRELDLDQAIAQMVGRLMEQADRQAARGVDPAWKANCHQVVIQGNAVEVRDLPPCPMSRGLAINLAAWLVVSAESLPANPGDPKFAALVEAVREL